MNKEELDNLKIGECFTLGDKKFKITKGIKCSDCDFDNMGCLVLRFYDLIPSCIYYGRKDNNIKIVFKEVK